MLDDEQAASFRDFVAARRPALHRAAYLLAGDGHSADDLVQATLLKVAGHWERVRAAGDPEAYVRRVLYNTHVSLWRRLRGREVSVAEPADAPRPSTEDSSVARLELRRALAQLTAKQRAVLVLRFYEDRTEAQVAAILRCSVGTVKSQTHRALHRLRELAPELADLMEVTR